MPNQSNPPPGSSVIAGELEPGATDRKTDSEHRKAPRHPCSASAVVTELSSQTRIAGRISDLGLGGCYVDTISPLTAGAAVRVEIDQGLRHFEALAKVVYAHPSMGMGLAFTRINLDQAEVLSAWVAESIGGNGQEIRVDENPIHGKLPAEFQEKTADLERTLRELIKMMVRRKLIGESEGAALLDHSVD